MLFIKSCGLVIDGMYDFEIEAFRVIFVFHVTDDDAMEEVLVYVFGSNVTGDCLHALHEVICVPIVAVMDKEPDADSQRDACVGILEIMIGV